MHRYYNLKPDAMARMAGERYRIATCGDCRLAFQATVPDAETLQLLYSEWVTGTNLKWIPHSENRHSLSEAMRLTALLLRTTGKANPAELRCLDFGFGRGVFLRAMVGCGLDAVGYDFADDRQAAAAAQGLRTQRLGDLGDYDFINTEQVFEHLPAPGQTFTDLANRLRPGGVLKVSVPFSRDMEAGDFQINWTASRYARRSPMPLAPLEHLQFYRTPSLLKAAERQGLRPVGFKLAEEFGSFILNPRRNVRDLGRILLGKRLRNYHLFLRA